ncbi:MAG: SprT-like domain-containing protein [Acidobacteriota bacterium]
MVEKKRLKRLVERAVRKRVSLRAESHPRWLVAVATTAGRALSLRVHPSVLETDPETQRLLIEFIRQPGRGVRRRLQSRLLCYSGAPRLRPEEQIQHGRLGRVHNLQKMYQRVNCRYFRGRLDVEIMWGRACHSRRRQSIDFGSYEKSKNVIRINPELDRSWVPTFFVEFILFHEMLHASIGFHRQGERRMLHSPEFREREGQFRTYRAAVRWERANLWRFVHA